MKKLLLALTILFGVLSVVLGIVLACTILFSCVNKTRENIENATTKIKDTVIKTLEKNDRRKKISKLEIYVYLCTSVWIAVTRTPIKAIIHLRSLHI